MVQSYLRKIMKDIVENMCLVTMSDINIADTKNQKTAEIISLKNLQMLKPVSGN